MVGRTTLKPRVPYVWLFYLCVLELTLLASKLSLAQQGAVEEGMLGERKMEGKKGKKTRGENGGGSAAVREWKGKDERKWRGVGELRPWCRVWGKKWRRMGKILEPTMSRVRKKNEEEKMGEKNKGEKNKK